MKVKITEKGINLIKEAGEKHELYTTPHFVLSYLNDGKTHSRREIKKHVRAKYTKESIDFLIHGEYVSLIKFTFARKCSDVPSEEKQA